MEAMSQNNEASSWDWLGQHSGQNIIKRGEATFNQTSEARPCDWPAKLDDKGSYGGLESKERGECLGGQAKIVVNMS